MKKTNNPKLSAERFTEEELKMIKDIKKAGYILEFTEGKIGAKLLEPYQSLISGKVRNIEISDATTLKKWDMKKPNSVYPLKDWHIIIKK